MKPKKKIDIVEEMDRIERREILDKDRDVTPETVWIVDYDLPQNSNRRRFYRRIQAWLRDHDVIDGTGWSTQSVVVTDDKEFAEFVYAEASQLGKAHLYKAEKIK